MKFKIRRFHSFNPSLGTKIKPSDGFHFQYKKKLRKNYQNAIFVAKTFNLSRDFSKFMFSDSNHTLPFQNEVYNFHLYKWPSKYTYWYRTIGLIIICAEGMRHIPINDIIEIIQNTIRVIRVKFVFHSIQFHS